MNETNTRPTESLATVKPWRSSLSSFSLTVAVVMFSVGLGLARITLSFPKPHPHPIPALEAAATGALAILVFGAIPGWLIGYGYRGVRGAIAVGFLSAFAVLLATVGFLFTWDY